MSYDQTCYLHHTAIYVKDIQWHIRFFAAIGMPVRRIAGEPNDPEQAWTEGGIQLVSKKDLEGPEGRLAHLGLYADDLDSALAEAYRWGVQEMPQGHNWFRLPDGLVIELMQGPQR